MHAQLPWVVCVGYTHTCVWLHGHIRAYALPVPPWPPVLGWRGLKIDHSIEGAARDPMQRTESERPGTVRGL